MAVLQHVTAIGELQRLVGVLLDEEDGHSLFTQLFNGVEDLLNDNWRKTQRRFIQQQQARLAHQGAADRQHLLLTAGHGPRTLNTTLPQAREEFVHQLDTGLILVAVSEEAAHRQVLFHRHAREDATPFRDYRHRFTHDSGGLPVGDVFAIKHNPTAGGARVAAQGTEQRGFARAVSPNQGDDFALIDMQADVVQRLDLAVVGTYLVKR